MAKGRNLLEIRTAILQRLYRDWDSRRGEREFPARADFDVLDFKYVIGQLALIDVSYDPLRFRFRLHGTGISQRVGYEMTGKELDDLPPPLIRASMRRHYSEVVGRRMPIVEARERQIRDDSIVDSEALALPLSSDGKTIDMLMVGVAFP
jgi:hypothetical protein